MRRHTHCQSLAFSILVLMRNVVGRHCMMPCHYWSVCQVTCLMLLHNAKLNDEKTLAPNTFGRCLPVRWWQNLHILTCLFEGFKSVKWPVKEMMGFIMTFLYHTKHIVLLLTSNSRISSKDIYYSSISCLMATRGFRLRKYSYPLALGFKTWPMYWQNCKSLGLRITCPSAVAIRW